MLFFSSTRCILFWETTILAAFMPTVSKASIHYILGVRLIFMMRVSMVFTPTGNIPCLCPQLQEVMSGLSSMMILKLSMTSLSLAAVQYKLQPAY